MITPEKINPDVACPEELEDTELCPIFRQVGHCAMNTDHIYFPRSNYKSGEAKAFCNSQTRKICEALHRERHTMVDLGLEPVPPKPSREEMLGVLNIERGK